MADLENKHVASLDFDIQKATQQLKDLTEIVNNLSNNTQKKFDGISKTIETSLGGAKLTQTITNQANLTNKAMNQIVVNAEKANQQRLSNAQKTANSSILIEQKSAAKIDEINAKKELSEQNYNQKRLLQEQKLQNQLTLETSKGIFIFKISLG